MIAWLRRDATVAKSPFMSLKSGMGSLVDTLRARLPDDAVVSNCAVRALERDGSRWRIVAESGEQYWADAVVLAAPAHIAARIVPPGRLAHELSEIPYVSTATVFFAFRRSDVQRSLEGAGFIVPPGEARILAGTWVSSKWELRAPEGAVLVRAFVGGARQSIEFQKLTDDALAGEVKEELVRLMGPLGEPLFTRVFRYDDSNPQPVVGHGARLARIAAELRALPGLYVAGAAYDGVGIPDCVRQGKNVAERLLRERC
jgi:oxygen-dependent protoporphyrinogen oxidase